MMHRPSLAIEFVGLPGAGKTLLCHEMEQALLAKFGCTDAGKITVYYRGDRRSRGQKLAAFVTHAVGNPITTYKIMRLILLSRQRRRLAILSLWFNIIDSIMLMHRSMGQITLIDQGVFQLAWSVVFDARNLNVEHEFAHLMSDIMLSSRTHFLVVVVRSPPEVIRRRLAVRADGASRLDSETAYDLAQGVDALDETMRIIDKVQRMTGAVRVCQVSNVDAGDPPRIAANVCAVIAEELRLSAAHVTSRG